MPSLPIGPTETKRTHRTTPRRRRITSTAILGFSALIAGTVPTGAARAQYSVAEPNVELGVWRFTPILHTVGGEQRIHSFVALADPSAVGGTNITAIQYPPHRGGELGGEGVEDNRAVDGG